MPEGGNERVEDKVYSLQQKQRPTVVALHSVHHKILSPSVQRLTECTRARVRMSRQIVSSWFRNSSVVVNRIPYWSGIGI